MISTKDPEKVSRKKMLKMLYLPEIRAMPSFLAIFYTDESNVL